MVVLGEVRPLPLMKGSFGSKSPCWAGPCSLAYLVTLSSLKRANCSLFPATAKPLWDHLKSGQAAVGEEEEALCALCLHNCCSWGGTQQLKIRLGHVLSCLTGQSPKKSGNFRSFPQYSALGNLGHWTFLIVSNLPPWGWMKPAVLTLLLLLSILTDFLGDLQL